MEVLTKPGSAETTAQLVQALRKHRPALADAVARAFERVGRWQATALDERDNRAEYLELQFNVFVDYLREYFERSDVTFKHLFVGEAIKALYDATLDDESARGLATEVFVALRGNLEAVLATQLPAGGWQLLDAHLASMQQTLTAPSARTQRVLLVGDCLFLDIVPFIFADLLDAGIRLLPDYVTSKNPVALRDELRAASVKRFDLVFFSPFSYEFSPEYAQLAEWRQSTMSAAAVGELVDKTWDDTRVTIDVLADLFDCPIHVHNSAAIVREESSVKRMVKARATARIRALAKARLNDLLARHVAQKNGESFQHLFVFDEDGLVQAAGEFEAGAYLYKTPLQHPVVMGRVLAQRYIDLIYVNALLLKRKVVVCDLDNTLWDGVIGEGDVLHFHDRQRVLQALKAKGVVLAINSKNDPANVHWRGGTLGDDDFVSAAISWDPKVHGMKRIQADLNLKTKDYVFVDDREDERELMHLAYPETLCVDATRADTWSRFALWASLLEDDQEMDRTLMYKQREARKAFVQEDVASEEERAAMFGSLGLKLTLVEAKSADLKRTAELINRTNQFNLEGSRTSFKEVSLWHESADHLILLGQSADRFGEMGTTCVAVVHCVGDEMRLLPFVLSCRVFGYGIEHGVMNHLRQVARQRGIRRIVGRYVATAQNAPCKDFLAQSGFVEQGGTWTCDTAVDGKANAGWLEIVVR